MVITVTGDDASNKAESGAGSSSETSSRARGAPSHGYLHVLAETAVEFVRENTESNLQAPMAECSPVQTSVATTCARENGIELSETDVAHEVHSQSASLPCCTICLLSTKKVIKKKSSRPTTHDPSSAQVQRWTSLILPPVYAPSGHGGIEVSATTVPLSQRSVTVEEVLPLSWKSSPVTCCLGCRTLFRKLEVQTTRGKIEAMTETVRFWRRRYRPQRPTVCFFCEKENAILGADNNLSASGSLTFDYRFLGITPDKTLHRTMCDIISFRLRLPPEVVAEFLAGIEQNVVCNRHKQNNRHALNRSSLLSSTCAISGCGAALNLTPLRIPAHMDFSDIQDAIASAFEGTLSVEDVLGKQVCDEHLSLLTKEMPSNAAHKRLNCIQSRSGPRLFAFILQLLVKFGVDSGELSSHLQDSCIDVSLRSLPEPASGILWFKDIYKAFCAFKFSGETMKKPMGWRTLHSLLSVSLAQFSIHSEKETKNGLLYFFRLQCAEDTARASRTISVLGAESLLPSKHTPTPCSIPAISSEFERAELFRIAKIYAENRSRYVNGDYSALDVVCVASVSYWAYVSWTLASDRLRKAWKRRVVCTGVENETFIWSCGNRQTCMPEGDIFLTLAPSELNHVRLVAMNIEHRVRASFGACGPLQIGCGAVAHMRGSKTLQNVLSRLGCCISYKEVLKLRHFWKRRRESHPSKALMDIPSYSFVNVALDNLDVSLSQKIGVRGSDVNGAHFTFASAHARKMPWSQAFNNARPPFKYNKCKDIFPTREDLINHFAVDVHGPDMTSYQATVLGMIYTSGID